jgi:RNA polymerase-binding transcription factor DksA
MTTTLHRTGEPSPPAPFCGTDADLRALRSDLEQQRSFRIDQLRQLTRLLQDPGTDDDAHISVALTLRSAATSVLADVEAALRRIHDRSFGTCPACGTPIPLSRLQALPMTRWCRPCQQANESTADVPDTATHPGSVQVALDIVEVWGQGSFPASDPPANW